MKNQEFDPICTDFEVEIVSDSGSDILYGASKELLYHFVYQSESNGYRTIDQSYVHRHELAAAAMESSMSKKSVVLSGGLTLRIDEADVLLSWKNSDRELLLSAGKAEILRTLQEDMERIKSIRSDHARPDAGMKAEALKMLSDTKPENIENSRFADALTDKDKEVIAFESATGTKLNHSVTGIFRELLKTNFEETSSLTDLLLENFEFIHKTDRCNCGDEGCFFDILKANEKAFFPEDYLNDGQLDRGKVKNRFEEVWKGLSVREQGLLHYLNLELQNSTLLNLAFLRPDFSLGYYQFLMTYPYQPDSEDDSWLRSVTTCVRYFQYLGQV